MASSSTNFNAADIRMGVFARFYERFWSEQFILLLVIATMAFAVTLPMAIRHPIALHNGMPVLFVLCVFVAMSLHRHRVMRLLRQRHVDRRFLGETAAVVFSLTLFALVGVTYGLR
ncbi:MAG: hypothetical protein ACM3PW_14095 [Chlamydiota bacterium]